MLFRTRLESVLSSCHSFPWRSHSEVIVLDISAMAIISGIIPFFYEANNEPFDGGALSLLIFIIAIQGWYAEKEMINFELMQKASAGLVGIVFAAMLFSYLTTLNWY